MHTSSNPPTIQRVDRVPNNERLATMEPWKATALCIGLVAMAIPLMILPGVAARIARPYHPIPEPIATAVIGIGLALCAFVAVGAALRVPLSDVFVRWPERSTVRWTLVGVSLATVVLATPILLLDGRLVVGYDGRVALVQTVGTAIAIGIWTGTLEEVLVRGYLLSIVGHQWNWPGAILLTSAVFGLLHNAHAPDTVGTVLYVGVTSIAGVTLALVTFYTGNVWNAVTIHAAWNAVFYDALLVFRVPEAPAGVALVTYVPTAPPLLFGGDIAYLTESPFAILVFTVATVAVFWYYHGRPVDDRDGNTKVDDHGNTPVNGHGRPPIDGDDGRRR